MTHVSEDRLLMYLDGDLSETDEAEVSRHINGCEDCQKLLSQHLEIEAALREMPAPRPVVLTPVSKRAVFRGLRAGVVAAAILVAVGATWSISLAGYWRGVQDQHAAMRRDHYALVSSEAALIEGETRQ